MKTLFEKIIDGELPADKVYEDEKILVIKDKYPKAPIHLLIIPKKVIVNLQAIESDDLSLMADVVRVAQIVAEKFNLTESGYRFLVNNGEHAGQEVEHLHFHILGGKPLGAICF